MSVVHHDTDNVHVHVAINKIHPQKLTLHEPRANYKTLSKLCAILEHELEDAVYALVDDISQVARSLG